ncbi:MAG: glycine oxidase ThiO [Pseudanabaenaceae cyanobacterium SKYGB_i_bin29]|nr:glycine oxidase ThiO [Pseudanabaenaceae cyanobacterium SKYG29]MDW8420257.1 glycine oxidase ThiO [Pseudanabaenaceae cyanobacterium SKYGB_i_bin29]
MVSDVLVIGGGIIGIATAWELAKAGVKVCVVERGTCGQGASWAAAGMLAPQAEQLTGDLLALGIKSRSLYPQWIKEIQGVTGQSCGYWCCGIIAPLFNGEAPPSEYYRDRSALLQRQPELGEKVTGGMWYVEDGQVDNRLLMQNLLLAARLQGVEIREGVNVVGFNTNNGQITSVQTPQGELVAGHYLLASGAWSRELLPVPVQPRKGQMLSFFDPQRRLQQVIYAPGAYIVPRQDGTIVLGATVEDVGFLPGITAGGINSLLSNAIAVLPFLADLPITETWWGFRPYAPKEIPLLGATKYENLTIGTGHYRNGILWAPITAHLLSRWILGQTADPLVQEFLPFLQSST